MPKFQNVLADWPVECILYSKGRKLKDRFPGVHHIFSIIVHSVPDCKFPKYTQRSTITIKCFATCFQIKIRYNQIAAGKKLSHYNDLLSELGSFFKYNMSIKQGSLKCIEPSEG